MGRRKKNNAEVGGLIVIALLAAVVKFIADNWEWFAVGGTVALATFVVFKFRGKNGEKPSAFGADGRSAKNAETKIRPSVIAAQNPAIAYKPINFVDVNYDLQLPLLLLKNHSPEKLYDERTISMADVDHFLFSGRFNSVLGLDGFTEFKVRLKDVIKKVNDDDFGLNYINLDQMFEALLHSGLYYEDAYLPEELERLKADGRWLTAYRYIAKNFSDISYKDYRELVRRFDESIGRSFYVKPDDTESFKAVLKKASLFRQASAVDATLMSLSMKELREICGKLDVACARSIEETVARLKEIPEEKIKPLLPARTGDRQTFEIKDLDLVSGEDIQHLDSYLRIIAKVIREEFAEFVENRRHLNIAA